MYCPVFQFMTKDGHKIRVASKIRSSSPSYQKGDRVTVLYDPWARKLVILAVEQVDPERAGGLKAEFPEGVESRGPEQERDLNYEEALTRRLLETVADLNSDLVKISARAARRITGL